MANILSGQKPLSIGAPKPQQLPHSRRNLGDAEHTRQLIFDNVLNGAQNLPPVSNKRHTLQLTDVHYGDPGEYSYKKQKDAILSNRTLGRRLVGTWQLIDNETGSVIEAKKQTVARVPYMTSRGTFIHNGNEYSVSNQMRLRPGVFTRVKDNGEVEAHANLLPGKGIGHRYYLDPEKGHFFMRVGQAKIPVYPLLKTLGVTDRRMQEAWGPAIYQANALKDDPKAIEKLYDRIVSRRIKNEEGLSKTNALRKAIAEMQIDPEVMERTLGTRYGTMGPDAIMDIVNKLLAVSRGEAKVDDRDHLAYQTVYGPEDLFAERISKDYGGTRRNALYKASFRGTLKSLQPGLLTKQIESVLLNSGLGQSLEEINPAEVFDKQNRISRLGEGGIPSIDAIPDEARSVQPSHMGFMDPVRTPESSKVGVDIFMSSAVRKGSDGRIYSPFRDTKTGKTVYRSPQDLAGLTVAFPGEMEKSQKRVGAMQGGQLKLVPKKDVDLVMPHFENAFSPLGNMIPMKSAVKAQRMAMASRMLTQALPLRDPEAPFVRSGIPGEPKNSYEAKYGAKMGIVRATKPGIVQRVAKNGVTIKYDDGTTKKVELYNNFPHNRKTTIHNTPVVQAGQRVKPGQLLAHSNYTDRQGVTALGKNARVAYIPFKGANFEDAVVISESFAKRMSSEQMYQESINWTKEYKQGKNNYIALFPSKYTRETLDNMDDQGVVKPGTVVNYGDPIILAAKQRDNAKNKVHRRKEASYNDQTQTWHHHSPGVVTDVLHGEQGTKVLVKSFSEMQVGDKLSGRYGDKGVISMIVPDKQMPTDARGNAFEVLLSPLGIISRTNPSQMVEAALGKIAAKHGKVYNVTDFEDIEDLTDFAIRELKAHKMKDLETVIDPETQRKVHDIFTGNRFFMKLHHMAEGKGQGRGTGGYTMTDTPAKGGETGSKTIGVLENNAILAHGATETIRDAAAIRGQRNEEFWLPFMQGLTPPKPKIPLTYRKFVNELKASGINVVQEGTKLNIMALTNKDVKAMAGPRFIENGETVRFDKKLDPVKGGLFDPTLTGGHRGNRWAAIKLEEPMPNPVMEEPIRRMLGLSKVQFEGVLAGREKLKTGTGPQAIANALRMLNVDREIEVAREQIKSGKKTYRDAAVRRLGYLKSAKKTGVHPKDWVLDAAPVLPPAFRPVSVMSDNKLPLVADANFLYKELIDANANLKDMKVEVDDVGEERLAVYRAFKAVTGLGDPIHPKLQEKNVKGLLKHIFGTSPKYGTVQRKLIGSTVDVVGRAVITPNPSLDMDEVGLPETRAWDVYRNFVARRLVRRGMSMVEALKSIENKSDLARQEMVNEMQERPVIINRAPVLHRFGVMAFYPKLVKGDTLQISPLVVGGFNADFDGDAMQYHVPVSDEAKEEAVERMLPSRNLLSPADFKSPVHKPSQDYTGGLYAASATRSRRPVRTFRDIKDVLHAYKRGEIEIDDKVDILR